MGRARRLTAALCGGLVAIAAGATPLDRDRDPVVMTGADLTSFAGIPVDRIVGFRYAGGWIQIPVQVDERAVLDFGTVYNQAPVGITALAYTDAGTYVGADPDASFDDDDELVLMAADTGDRVPHAQNLPAGLVAGSGLEVEISDPLDGSTGYVYLFESDGSLDPGAGSSYGTYAFNLLAGSYIPDYDLASGPNPEDSEFVSPLYRTHFSDRWIRDELNVTTEASSGVDILDRHKNLFGPGVCVRTEDTFSNGLGAFFANISGPVRSIRSYVGANSGPLTQRNHVFYAGRQDITTFLRVHAIPGVMDLYDYGPDATGMTYYNDLNPSGAVVEGSPDFVSPGAIQWEMATGAQGSLIVAHSMETDIPGFAYTSYYSDDTTPSVTQCTGDAFEYATSGLWINAGIPNTDPSQGAHNILEATRVVYYETPGQTVTDAAFRFDQATTPLELTTAPLPDAPHCDDGADNDGDGLADLADPGCGAPDDASERSDALVCDNGLDDDGDGRSDFDPLTYANPGDPDNDPAGQGDPVCTSPTFSREYAQCQDGVDNDGDGGMDYDGGRSVHGTAQAADPQCVVPWGNKERRRCGLGYELALLMAALLWLRRRGEQRAW